MSSSPRVSIGMPVYNSEKYLEGALNSVLAQTYEDFELIICDNASTDQTPQICQFYALKDQRIHYYRNTYNLGANPNINQTFKLSSGEYFKWAFYDDLISPEFISRCVDILDRDPEIVLCVPKSNVIDEYGNHLGVNEYKANTTMPYPQLRFRNLVLNQDAGWEVFGLIRSSVLKQTALHASYPGSDLVLLAELALYGPFYIFPEALSYPRIHPEQTWMLIPKERDRVVFEDSSLDGKIVLPKWRWVFGYLRAIRRAPLNIFTRAQCRIIVIRWILEPDHFKALGKDIILALKAYITKSKSALQFV